MSEEPGGWGGTIRTEMTAQGRLSAGTPSPPSVLFQLSLGNNNMVSWRATGREYPSNDVVRPGRTA